MIAIFIFALIGMAVTGNIFHELSHKADLQSYVTDEKICFLEFDNERGSMGHYSYIPKEESSEDIERVLKYTEIKAVGGNIAVGILFLISFYYYIDDYYEEKSK